MRHDVVAGRSIRNAFVGAFAGPVLFGLAMAGRKGPFSVRLGV